jgi:hypothetical protein
MNYERTVRRQLFDDIMNLNRGVTGIFRIRRSFLKTTWFSRKGVFFLKLRGFPGTTRFLERGVFRV